MTDAHPTQRAGDTVQHVTARDGTRISYIRYDGSNPPFLSVSTPGAPPLAMRAERGGQVSTFTSFRRGRGGVWFDWRGAGESDPIEGDLSIHDLVADLEAVVSTVGAPVDALVWGRAGFAVFHHAAERPDRYRSIRIDGGALRPGESWQGRYNRPGWESNYSEHLQGIARHYSGTSPQQAMSQAIRWERAVPASSFRAYLEAERDLDLTTVLPHVDVLTWVTARLPVDYEPATQMHSLLPNSLLTIYEPGLGRYAFGDSGRTEWDQHLGVALGEPPSEPIDLGNGSQRNGDLTAPITGREQEVLNLIAAGDGNREIGDALGITEGTVKRHVSNLLHKTGLKNRRQLMRFADRLEDND